MTRASGVLLPVFSLPSAYGIGSLGEAAYEWIDFLVQAKQSYWQMLPIGPTSYGDSPYQNFSAFAGNPYFIDLDFLVRDGLLMQDECDTQRANQQTPIDYAWLYQLRLPLLRKAFERFTADASFELFCDSNAYWLDDYALYSALKTNQQEKSWIEWQPEYRLRNAAALTVARQALAQDIRFTKFVQYLFFKQWYALKEYANHNGVQIIGDMPIYVALDSADVWVHGECFQLNQDRMPVEVSGCPPDGFSDDGQLWGNPLYDWDFLKATGYKWWMQRLAAHFNQYDIVRIDHFRGLESYYAVEAGQPNARKGRWRPGPGLDFIRAIQAQFGTNRVIAEDLGFQTTELRTFLKESGYPGMKVLQFAFDTREDSDYLPHKYNENCVAYTGTHDNNTVRGWMKEARKADVAHAKRYLHINLFHPAHTAFIEATLNSAAALAIIPLQDYLALDDTARMNIPSTLGGNWVWRMPTDYAKANLAQRIAKMAVQAGRAQ